MFDFCLNYFCLLNHHFLLLDIGHCVDQNALVGLLVFDYDLDLLHRRLWLCLFDQDFLDFGLLFWNFSADGDLLHDFDDGLLHLLGSFGLGVLDDHVLLLDERQDWSWHFWVGWLGDNDWHFLDADDFVGLFHLVMHNSHLLVDDFFVDGFAEFDNILSFVGELSHSNLSWLTFLEFSDLADHFVDDFFSGSILLDGVLDVGGDNHDLVGDSFDDLGLDFLCFLE